jgi:hypothetical protein
MNQSIKVGERAMNAKHCFCNMTRDITPENIECNQSGEQRSVNYFK